MAVIFYNNRALLRDDIFLRMPTLLTVENVSPRD